MEKNKEVETKFLEYFSQILQAQERDYKNTNHRKRFYIARHIRKKKESKTTHKKCEMLCRQNKQNSHISQKACLYHTSIEVNIYI